MYRCAKHYRRSLEKQLPNHGLRPRVYGGLVLWKFGSPIRDSGRAWIVFCDPRVIVGFYGSSVVPKGSILVGWSFLLLD